MIFTRLSHCLIYIFRIFRIMQGSFCFPLHKMGLCVIKKFFFSYAKMHILRKKQIKQQVTSHPFLCSGVKITDKTCQKHGVIISQGTLYNASRFIACLKSQRGQRWATVKKRGSEADSHFPPNGEKDKRGFFYNRDKTEKRGFLCFIPIVGIEQSRQTPI